MDTDETTFEFIGTQVPQVCVCANEEDWFPRCAVRAQLAHLTSMCAQVRGTSQNEEPVNKIANTLGETPSGMSYGDFLSEKSMSVRLSMHGIARTAAHLPHSGEVVLHPDVPDVRPRIGGAKDKSWDGLDNDSDSDDDMPALKPETCDEVR